MDLTGSLPDIYLDDRPMDPEYRENRKRSPPKHRRNADEESMETGTSKQYAKNIKLHRP